MSDLVLTAAHEALLTAARRVLDEKFENFRAKNGRAVGVQDDSGEKCWIVPFEAMDDLRAAVHSIADAMSYEDLRASGGIFAGCPQCGHHHPPDGGCV